MTRDLRWLVPTVACATVVACAEGPERAPPDADPTPPPSAASVLSASHRALAGAAGLGEISYARFLADATAPDGAYQVEVRATRAGAVRLEFLPGFSAAIRPEGSWMRGAPGENPGPLSDTMATFVRGHDLLMNVLFPDVRYAPLRYQGEEAFAEVPAIRLDGVDGLGAPIALFYSVADTLPLGYRVVDHVRGGGPVTTTLAGWDRRSDVLLPTSARFVQGDEAFDYALAEVQVAEAAPPGSFEPPT